MLTDALKRLTKHSVVYALGPAVHRAIGFLLLPLVTAYIGTRGNYGVVEMAAVTLAVAAQVLGINLLHGMARYYKEYEREEDRRALVGTCALLLLATTGVACAAAIAWAEPAAELLFGDRRYADALRVTGAILVAQTVSQVGLRWLQVLERSVAYGAITTAKLLLEVGLKVWFLVALGLAYMGVLWSVLCGELVVALGVGVALLARTGASFSGAMAKRLARYSAPLVLSGLCAFVLHQADRFFVLRLDGEDQVGLYALCYKLGALANVVVLDAFGLIWFPFVFGVRDEEHVRRLCRAVAVYLVLVMSVATLALALFGPEVVRAMADEKFFEAHEALPLVAAGYLFWALYQIVGTVFYLREKTWIVSVLVAGAAALNLGANAVLVPRLGYAGAAWATLLTFAALAGAAWVVAERTWRVGHETARVLAPIAVAALLYGAGRGLLPEQGGLGTVAGKLAIVLALPGILALGGYLKVEEKDKIRALLGRVFVAGDRRR